MVELKVAVMASGTGSNFKAIIDSIKSGRLRIKIQLLLTERIRESRGIFKDHAFRFEPARCEFHRSCGLYEKDTTGSHQ